MYLFTTGHGMLLVLATFGCLGIISAAPEDSSVGQLSEADPSAHDRFTRASICKTSCDICSNTRGSLKVIVRNAWGLPDKDGFPNGDSDPYVTVTAVRESSLTRTSRNTHEVKNSRDPTWNKSIWFGCGRWRFIEVSVWDGDGGCDDNLMPARYYPICNTGKCTITYSYGGAKLYLDIELTPDGNECHPNPCKNGGTCTDQACGFRCSCSYGYHGTHCEYSSDPCKRQAQLDVFDIIEGC